MSRSLRLPNTRVSACNTNNPLEKIEPPQRPYWSSRAGRESAIVRVDSAAEVVVRGRAGIRGWQRPGRRVAADGAQWPTNAIGSICVPSLSTSKCTCGPVERPVEPTTATAWPRSHLIADRHQRAGVVRIARDVAVAVVDLDQVAVALARPGPGHDAGGHRQHIGAGIGWQNPRPCACASSPLKGSMRSPK